jgi:tetratricopeptide (TPR) repeat protein
VKKAVEAATKALELDGWNDFRYIDTLAAAYANAGRYDNAQATIKDALKHAPQDNAEILQELAARESLYNENKPFRDAARVTLRPQPPRR